MSFILMVVGILAAAIGVILIGFGIPINEFSLGNTLILAGTVALVGGLIIFALSRALSQLAQIAEVLAGRPLAAAVSAAESHEPEPARAPARPPLAQRGRSDMPARPPEPRMQPEFTLPQEVEPMRPPPGPRVSEPPMVEEPEDMPLSPRPPSRPAADAAPGGWRPPRPSLEPRTPESPRARPAGPEAGRPPEAPALDASWERRSAARPAERTVRQQPPVRREPAREPEPAAEPSQPEPVSILKSGVVDGMAYTLYTDGSIEAELAQGVVRFGSIEELRNHLEKSA